MFETDIDKNFKEIDETTLEMKKIKKAIRRRKQKHQHHREILLRPNDLNISKTEIRNKKDALKQKISPNEEVKEQIKLKIKELKKKIKNIPIENPFNFTDYVEKQKEDNDTDLGLFLKLAEEYKIMCIQTSVNTLIEDMEKLKNGFFTNGYFSLGDEGEIDTNRFLKIVMN